jgi:hypothetical protein
MNKKSVSKNTKDGFTIQSGCCTDKYGGCLCGYSSGKNMRCDAKCAIGLNLKKSVSSPKPLKLQRNLKLTGCLFLYHARKIGSPLVDFSVVLASQSGFACEVKTDSQGQFTMFLRSTSALYSGNTSFDTYSLGSLLFDPLEGTPDAQNFYLLTIVPAEAHK